MKDDKKTKKQLVHELTELRSQKAEGISAELVAEGGPLRYAESIVETVRGSLLVLDANLRIISANRNFYRTFEVTPAETIGSFIYDLGNKQWDIPSLRELLEKILPEKQALEDFEVTHDFQDLGHITMLLNALQIYRKETGTQMILLAIEDITEHKRLEEVLTEAEARYRHVYETASDGIVLLEKHEGKITHANRAVEKMLGYSLEESVGNKLEDIGIVNIGDFQTLMRILDEVGITHYTDVTIKTKSGQQIEADIYLANRAKLVQCNIRDISERKQAQYELSESDKRYRVLFDAIDEGFCIIEVIFDENEKPIDYRFLEINPSFEKQTGLIDAQGKKMRDLAPKHEQHWFDIYGKIAVTGEPARFENRAEQLHRWYDVYAFRVGRPENRHVAILFNDITERKETECQLNERIKELEILYSLGEIAGREGLTLDKLYQECTDILPQGCRYQEITCARIVIGDSEFRTKNFAESAWMQSAPVKVSGSVVGKIEVGHLEEMPEEDEGPFLKEETQLIDSIAERLGQITERKQAQDALQQTLESLRNAVSTTIQVIISTVEARDPYTAAHQIRSADLARAIATEMKLSPDRIEGIRIAASIHDLGKLSVPAEMLSKPGKLTETEFSLIKEHSRNGYDILKDVESSWPLAEIVYQHHERMDGSGYPRNLKGDEILLEARILAVCDVVEAMASHRPYRAGLGIDAALREIEDNRGRLYDENVVDVCLTLFREKGYQFTGA